MQPTELLSSERTLDGARARKEERRLTGRSPERAEAVVHAGEVQRVVVLEGDRDRPCETAGAALDEGVHESAARRVAAPHASSVPLPRMQDGHTGGASWGWPAALAACLLASCGEGAGVVPGPPIRGSRGLFSLLSFKERMEVLEVPEGESVNQRLLKPRGAGGDEYGSYPAVVVRPTTVLRYEVAETAADAVLQYAVAIARNAYQGSGRVRFSGELDGEPLFAHWLDCSREVPNEDRKWHDFEVPFAGGSLVLRADYEGNRPRGPIVGFGNLRIAVPFEVQRTRSSPAQPNVLLVVIDTLRADRLHAAGNARDVSPVMDRLAAEGMRFERAYSSAPWTIPGTASVLTGQSPPQHGLGDSSSYYLADGIETQSPPQHGLGDSSSYYLADGIETLSDVFSRAGFTTAAFTCNPLISRSRNFDQGFEHFVNYRWARSSQILDDLVRWIEQVDEQRFFLYVHFVDPHYPYEPDARTRERYGFEDPEGLLEEDLRQVLDRWYEGEEIDEPRIEVSLAHRLDLYDGEIYQVDSVLGAVLEALERRGLGDRTLLCVTSDHGEEFMEHGLVGHNNQLFDESVQVPLILWGPRVPRGEVIPFPVENRHVAPTLLHLSGVEPPAGMRGPDLTRPEDRGELEGKGVYLTTGKGRWADFGSRSAIELGRIHSLVEDGWRLIHGSPSPQQGLPAIEALYDLGADPECRINVADRHPERVASMKRKLRDWREEGRANRPEMVPATEETRDLLRSLGYVGDD